jgi:hypothetical protein
VILKVGDTQVTRAEFESRGSDFETQGGENEGLSEKDRRQLGDDYASVLMLAHQAVASHLDASPEVSHQLAVARLQILSDAEFASLMRQAQPTAAQIREYYSAHIADYDEVRIRRLFIWKRQPDSKNKRGVSPQEARRRADAILDASAKGRDTASLTAGFTNSDDGLLDAAPMAFTRGELPPKMERAAFAAKDGEWSEAEDTADAIILLQLIKRDRQPLEQVSPAIEKRLQGEKMQAMLNDLKKKTGIWMDEGYFGTAVAPVPGAQLRNSNPPSTIQTSNRKEEMTDERDRQK